MALNDYLFSEEFLFEGEQAEEYKKRKAAEKDAAKKADDDYLDKRWKRNASKKNWDLKDDKSGDTYSRPGRKMTKQNPNYGIKHPIKTVKGQSADQKMYNKVRDKHDVKTGENRYATKHTFNTKYNSRADQARTDDATYRHARRHPEQYKESVELYDGHIELI